MQSLLLLASGRRYELSGLDFHAQNAHESLENQMGKLPGLVNIVNGSEDELLYLCQGEN